MTMSHKKRRVLSSIMEDESYQILRTTLPQEWVLHKYSPDYGIDLVVETFEFIDEKQTVAETLGEFFFVQLKSQKSVTKKLLTVNRRYNVEKNYIDFSNDKSEIEVIAFKIDINELLTVQSMGYATPTILFLVDLETKNIYFICLNDYIEKILLPNKTFSKNNKTVTIYIPETNNLSNKECIYHLSFLARRSKLFGAFNKFNYQRHELEHMMSPDLVLHFISIIKQYDFWNAKIVWPALEGLYDELLLIEKYYTHGFIAVKDCLNSKNITEQNAEARFKLMVYSHWDKLCNLGCIYEEICKEWFLPTKLWNDWY